jgi:hypothetical protein
MLSRDSYDEYDNELTGVSERETVAGVPRQVAS